MTVSSAVSQLGPLLYWSFAPPFLANLVLRLSPNPTASPSLRRVYIARLLSLLAALYISRYFSPSAPSYYGMLGVSPATDTDGVRRAFRAAARHMHPDKAGVAGVDAFVSLRAAADVLTDPVKRFAYDHYGPSASASGSGLAETPARVVREGTASVALFYGVSACLAALAGARTSRFVPLVLLFATEACVRSSSSSSSSSWHSPYTPHQLAETLRHAGLTILLAAQHIAVPAPKTDPLPTAHAVLQTAVALSKRTKSAVGTERLDRLHRRTQEALVARRVAPHISLPPPQSTTPPAPAPPPAPTSGERVT